MPIRRAVLMTRQAISPRLAIRIFLNMDGGLPGVEYAQPTGAFPPGGRGPWPPDGPSAPRRWFFWPMAPAASAGTMTAFDNSPSPAMVPSRLLRPFPLALLAVGAALLIAFDPA